jgi:signal transduction histidine kinase/ActR/RegA family two-component response regulator
VVAIGLSERELLATWYSSVRIYGIAGLTFTTAMVVLTFLLVQQLRRREVLIKAVQASEAQLQQAQKMESIGQLAGGIAHDFNNLLTAIIINVDFARSRFRADDPIVYELGEIQQAADRAAALTRQLLAFARKQTIAPQVLNCNDLILNIDKLLRRLIGEHIELVIHPAADVGLLKADASQIEQLLVNLALNARDAMPNGGKLTITTRNVLIEAAVARAQRPGPAQPCVQITVSDTGVGMTPEVQAHMFEPFFTTKEPGQGTGLGLATCYGIVTQHGGTIEVTSAVGQGTTMTIYLPAVEGAADAIQAIESVADLPSGTETILLVEDEVSVREAAGRVLRTQGYTVLEAANGEEALWMAESRNGDPIDLLLTDMVMPRMGGLATAEQILRMYPSIKVLFMSGYTGNAKIQHGALARPVDLLQKPFSHATLAREVREALDRR